MKRLCVRVPLHTHTRSHDYGYGEEGWKSDREEKKNRKKDVIEFKPASFDALTPNLPSHHLEYHLLQPRQATCYSFLLGLHEVETKEPNR